MKTKATPGGWNRLFPRSFQQNKTTVPKPLTHRRPSSFTNFQAKLPLKSVHGMGLRDPGLLGKGTFTAMLLLEGTIATNVSILETMLIGHKLNLHLSKRAHFLQAVGIFPLNLGVFHLSLMLSHTQCQSL